MGIGAALFFGNLLSTEAAASVRPNDIFELFMGDQSENSPEARERDRVKARQQRRASIFDLLHTERSNNAPVAPTRKHRLPEIAATPVQKKPSKPAHEVVSRPVLETKRAKTELASAPVPRTKPGVAKSTSRTQGEPATEPVADVTCEEAREIISKFAFSQVNQIRCSGDVYEFAAMRDGKRYLIKISAQNGELLEVKKDNGASAANEPVAHPPPNYDLSPRSELPLRWP